jgi:hypothetical protein
VRPHDTSAALIADIEDRAALIGGGVLPGDGALSLWSATQRWGEGTVW